MLVVPLKACRCLIISWTFFLLCWTDVKCLVRHSLRLHLLLSAPFHSPPTQIMVRAAVGRNEAMIPATVIVSMLVMISRR